MCLWQNDNKTGNIIEWAEHSFFLLRKIFPEIGVWIESHTVCTQKWTLIVSIKFITLKHNMSIRWWTIKRKSEGHELNVYLSPFIQWAEYATLYSLPHSLIMNNRTLEYIPCSISGFQIFILIVICTQIFEHRIIL